MTPLQNGKYHIVNVSTEGYAALLSDTDQSDVVTIAVGLRDEERGYEWTITHLGQATYRIQNSDFNTPASHDPHPTVDGGVQGKKEAKQWIIQKVQSEIYCISPGENPDIFWTSPSRGHATPVEFGQSGASKRCHWHFRPLAEAYPDNDSSSESSPLKIHHNAPSSPFSAQRFGTAVRHLANATWNVVKMATKGLGVALAKTWNVAKSIVKGVASVVSKMWNGLKSFAKGFGSLFGFAKKKSSWW